jgi:hypothetical protein
MMVLWDQDLIGIYNDGLRPVLGTVNHPDGPGAPAKEVWSELWDVIGLLFGRSRDRQGHLGREPAPCARTQRVPRRVLLHVFLAHDS